MAFRAVFIDVAGTLIDVRDGVGRQYAALARDAGIAADDAALECTFRRAFAASPAMAFPETPPEGRAARERAVWKEIVTGTFASLGLLPAFGDRFDAYFTRLYEHFGSPDAWEVQPDAFPLLDGLRQAGCHVGVITNFDGRVRGLLEALGLAWRFDSITVSSVVGAAKPDPAIFRAALAAAKVDALAALHCGDSIDEDVAGARAAGFTPVLVDRAGRHRLAGGVRRVESLADILDLI